MPPEEVLSQDNNQDVATEDVQESSADIKNPTALLNAYERTKAKQKEIQSELEKLKKQYSGVDIEEYQSLLQEKQKMAQSQAEAEEKKLLEEKNWEALIGKKVGQVEEQYKLKLDKATSDLTNAEKERQSLEQRLAIASQEADELKRKFIAYDSFIQNKGKPESFRYVWDADLAKRTRIGEDGQSLELLKAPGLDEVAFDEEGNIINVSAWMQKFRQNGGSNFFNPLTDAAGSGASPSVPGVSPRSSNRQLTISSSDLGSVKAMKAIASQLSDGDVSKAIQDGRIKVIPN